MSGKKMLLIILGLVFMIQQGFAQEPVCLPDSIYADSLAGVYPTPFHPIIYPNGGLKDTACLNHPFEMILTAVVRDTIKWNGLSFPLNHLLIEENGILNLPEGLGYSCNPPNCKFESNTLGCMIISGTPLITDTTGTYDLRLKSEIVAANGLITIRDTLPGFLIPGSHYYLELEEEDSEHCQDRSANRNLNIGIKFSILSNPAVNELLLEINTERRAEMALRIFDLNGVMIFNKKIVETQGSNKHRISIDYLDAGMYVLILSNTRGRIAKRFVVMNP